MSRQANAVPIRVHGRPHDQTPGRLASLTGVTTGDAFVHETSNPAKTPENQRELDRMVLNQTDWCIID